MPLLFKDAIRRAGAISDTTKITLEDQNGQYKDNQH